MIHKDDAYACLAENLKMYIDPRVTPEKFNLYKGLALMAKTVQEMQAELHQLRKEIQQLRR